MECILYKVSVPGSLMMFGEHAVLHNKYAIVTAIDKYLHISLTPLEDKRYIKIISTEFNDFITNLDSFHIVKSYIYVLTAIKLFLPKIKTGFILKIESDFSCKLGLGSSAAITVAIIFILNRWIHPNKIISNLDLYQQSLNIIHLVQGFGSGADVAASIFGGVLSYKKTPLVIRKIAKKIPLIVIYSGNKMPTSKVINLVNQQQICFRYIIENIYNTIDLCTKEAIIAIKSKNFIKLGQLMNIHQGLHDALGVNNKKLSDIIFFLRSNFNIYGAKISGAGLGDCVIAIGKLNSDHQFKQLNINVNNFGIKYV